MRRRMIAAIAALVLLAGGTVVLLAYGPGADARALAGVRTTEVLVADQPIPAGTPAEELGSLVRGESVPAKVALEGGVTDLAELAGRVANVDLLPGEQLVTSRFAAPEDLSPQGTVPVPKGLQEISVLLEPQRAVGGRLSAGDAVGVVVSLGDGESGRTHAVLHQVLVTQVQGAPAPVDRASAGDPETAAAGVSAPSSSVMVTLAVSAAQAEAVVFAIEHGTLWLSLEPAEADTTGTRIVDQTRIYEENLR